MQAWMQEAHWIGPHCSDGSMLRDKRLSRQQCLNSAVREPEPIIPGCESELIDERLPNNGASPWLEKIKQSSNPNAVDRPSPEESDYFYEEYVDYPFNETNINNITAQQKNVTYGATTARPSTSSFYAGTNMKYNFSTTFTTTEAPNLPSATFTFFGVPLPSLNINKLWGSGRSTKDRKSDQPPILGNSRGTGRIQNYPVDAPHVQTGGFIPIVSATTGGFHPVNNAFGEPYQNTTTSWPEDFPSSKFSIKRTQIYNDTEKTTEFNALQQIPTSFSIIEKVTYPMTSTNNENSEPTAESNDFKHSTLPYTTLGSSEEITTVSYSEKILQTENTGILEQIRVEENKYFNYSNTEPSISTEDLYNKNQNYEDLFPFFDKNDYFDNSQSSNYTNVFDDNHSVTSELQDSTTNDPLSNLSGFLATSKTAFGLNSTSNILEEYNKSSPTNYSNVNNEELWTHTTKNPSLLSDILAPNGHMPFYKSSGRPTITKVVFADQSLPNEEYLRSPSSIEIETIASYELTTVKTIYNDSSMNWYFDNYNKTNHIDVIAHMEPGLNHYRSNANHYKPDKIAINMVLILSIVNYYTIKYY